MSRKIIELIDESNIQVYYMKTKICVNDIYFLYLVLQLLRF